MNNAAAWSLALSMALVGACVHLVARPWSSRRVLFVDVGRERNDEDDARTRRVLVFNAAVTAVGIALSFLGSDSAVAVIMVSLVLPFLPISYLLVEMVRITRSLPKIKEPTRFSVPLDDPPPMTRYLSPALQLAHGALIAGSSAALVWIIDKLPASVPMHWNMKGQVDRYGSPTELWIMVGFLVFDWALCWMVAYGVAKERWALPPSDKERYAELQLERRSVIVRMVELLLLLINLSIVVLALGLAYGSIPGNEGLTESAIIFGVVLMVVGTLVPLALFMPKMVKLQEQLKTIAGTDVLGTHASGWRAGGLIYYAPEDPAVFVPKKVGIGQTLNFGRPGAWIFIGAITVLPLLITFVAIWAAS